MYERSEPLDILTPAADEPASGVLVFGAPRGGTSMVAGVLRLSGLDMGARQGRGNNEDLDIQAARGNVGNLGDVTHPDYAAALERMRPVIEARAAEGRPWGWKDPHGGLYARDVLDVLPSPRLIAVFRDPAAAAARIHMLTGQSVAEALNDVLWLYGKAQGLIAEPPAPLAMASYEKALVRPERFVEQLAFFCHLEPTPEQVREAVAFISPERGHGDPHSPGWPREGAL